MIARRGFLGGLLAALAAPAIIRTPGLLMPVKALPESVQYTGFYSSLPTGMVTRELIEITRRAVVPRIYTSVYADNPLMAHFQRNGVVTWA
jgi:hypothetical protein